MRRSTTVVLVAVVAVMSGGAIAARAVPQPAKTTTLRFYSKVVVSRLFSSTGKPLPSTVQPTRGDYIIAADDDYAGTYKSHSSDQGGSDFLRCVFVNAHGEASCTGVITVGSSLVYVIANQNFSKVSALTTFKVAGGTGQYAGATGTVVSGATSNFVLTLRMA